MFVGFTGVEDGGDPGVLEGLVVVSEDAEPEDGADGCDTGAGLGVFGEFFGELFTVFFVFDGLGVFGDESLEFFDGVGGGGDTDVVGGSFEVFAVGVVVEVLGDEVVLVAGEGVEFGDVADEGVEDGGCFGVGGDVVDTFVEEDEGGCGGGGGVGVDGGGDGFPGGGVVDFFPAGDEFVGFVVGDGGDGVLGEDGYCVGVEGVVGVEGGADEGVDVFFVAGEGDEPVGVVRGEGGVEVEVGE